MKTTLVVMAAGMGSRFGGLKQAEPITPDGKCILDFSVYDAVKAGFDKTVFIIREDMEADFKRLVGDRIAGRTDVEYVLQDMKDLPEGRTKPFGTAHAILCCADVVKEPFAIINADDYYGHNAFFDIQKHLANAKNGEYAMDGVSSRQHAQQERHRLPRHLRDQRRVSRKGDGGHQDRPGRQL